MKLRQNGIVSLMIGPAVFLAGGWAYMKLHLFRQDYQDNFVLASCISLSFFFDLTSRFLASGGAEH
jgi:hypothetical protein